MMFGTETKHRVAGSLAMTAADIFRCSTVDLDCLSGRWSVPSGGSRPGSAGIDRAVAQPRWTSAGREGWRKTCLA